MPITPTDKIWHNGKLIPWESAKIHVLSHVVSYGSAVFEGIRCYETKNGPAIFRVRDHMKRLVNSARIYRIDLPYSVDELSTAAVEVARVNKMTSCYIRPIVLRGYGDMGVGGLSVPTETYLACWAWGKYLGPEALETGVDVCVSSWNRLAPNTMPSMAKAASNYMNSQLIHMEAVTNGYAEGIALDTEGYVSEGSGENIFLVMDGTVVTPPIGSSVLPGITRSSVLKLCEDLKIPVREQNVPREMLYLADEVFFSGTAAEITPLRSIDRIMIGKGSRGSMTKLLQEEFFAIIKGTREDRYDWLTPISVPLGASSR